MNGSMESFGVWMGRKEKGLRVVVSALEVLN
jgi:hypothetical protein